MSKTEMPSIRFYGFDNDWEQRKLSDITFPAGEKNKDNLPLESYSITNEHGFVPQDEKFENGGTMREADKRMYYIVSPNSFAYNPARINVGSIGYQNIGKNVIVSSLYEVFKTSEDVDDRLLWHWFKSPDFQKLIMQLQEGGVRLYFYYDKLCMGEVSLPSLEEQRKIGKLFDTLDNLITLHQRKFEKLTNVKKSMLEKMFPQNDSSYPEIRFKGFTDPWEQRKFGEDNDLLTGYPFESEKFSEEGIKLVRGMNVKRGYLDFSNDICMRWNSTDGLENYLLEADDILIQMDGALIGKSYAKIAEEQLPALLVQRVTRARTRSKDACTDFMYQTIQRDFLRYIGMNKTETAVPHLSLNDIYNFKIMVPCLEEQQQIGAYFTNLDNLITLHQRELEKLQNIKKSMLEKMFV